LEEGEGLPCRKGAAEGEEGRPYEDWERLPTAEKKEGKGRALQRKYKFATGGKKGGHMPRDHQEKRGEPADPS